MNGFINALRVGLLFVVGVASLAAGAALLWRWKSPAVASTMTTWQVLALIGLFVLPVATLTIIFRQIHVRRRRRLIERIERRAREKRREREARQTAPPASPGAPSDAERHRRRRQPQSPHRSGAARSTE